MDDDLMPDTNPPDDDGTVLALDPDPAGRGTRIDRAIYDAVRSVVMAAVEDGGTVEVGSLETIVSATLIGQTEHTPEWYTQTVVGDLIARGLLERTEDEELTVRIPLQ